MNISLPRLEPSIWRVKNKKMCLDVILDKHVVNTKAIMKILMKMFMNMNSTVDVEDRT